FQFVPEWTLKTNNLFGGRSGTRVSRNGITLLQDFFHAGNADKSDRYPASDQNSFIWRNSEVESQR
ncbi:10715_t:CDS:1, partial [Rhizophagus irregularis]